MFANPEELLRYLKDEDVKFVDVRFCDLPGVMQHFNVPVESFDDERLHRRPRLRRLLDPRLPGRSTSPTCCCCRTWRPRSSTRSGSQKTLALNFFIHDPFTREAYSPRPAQRRQEGRGLPGLQRHRRHRLLRRRGRVLHLRLDPPRDQRQPGVLLHRLGRGLRGTPARRSRAATAATRPPTRAATSRCRRSTTTPTCATRMVRNLIDAGFTVERSHHEVGTAGQAEINYRFSTLLHAGDQLQLFKYIVKNTAWARRQDRHVHAQAALRRQRLRHAHPPEPLAGRRAAVLRRDRLRRPVRHGPLVHRRPAAPRAVAAGVHQPDGQLVPPPGARLRGAGQPGLLAAQPLRLHPHPGDRQQRRRPSASSSACRTRRPTRTSPSRRC